MRARARLLTVFAASILALGAHALIAGAHAAAATPRVLAIRFGPDLEVKDVEIPAEMQRAMARQAEAERERRAKVINAEGEFQASERLKDAALVIEEHPIALQLRYLQTLLEIGGSNSSTIIFPAPIDLIKPFLEQAPEKRPITPPLEPEQRRAA